jgi:hypothetical protein
MLELIDLPINQMTVIDLLQGLYFVLKEIERIKEEIKITERNIDVLERMKRGEQVSEEEKRIVEADIRKKIPGFDIEDPGQQEEVLKSQKEAKINQIVYLEEFKERASNLANKTKEAIKDGLEIEDDFNSNNFELLNNYKNLISKLGDLSENNNFNNNNIDSEKVDVNRNLSQIYQFEKDSQEKSLQSILSNVLSVLNDINSDVSLNEQENINEQTILEQQNKVNNEKSEYYSNKESENKLIDELFEAELNEEVAQPEVPVQSFVERELLRREKNKKDTEKGFDDFF